MMNYINYRIIPEQAEATAFFARMVVLGDPVPDDYKPLYNTTIAWLKNTMGRNGTQSLWDSLDFLRIEATYSKTAALQNIIKDAHNGTITNDHGASFTAKRGLKGNGTNFSVNCNFNPFTALKFDNSSACLGVLVLDDKSGDNNHEVCALKTGGSDGVFIRAKRASSDGYQGDGNVNNVVNTSPFVTVLSARGWHELDRSSSGAFLQNQNGWRVIQNTVSSGVRPNMNVIEFAASVNGTISAWSSQTHGAIWAGNFNVEAATIISIINKYFIFKLNDDVSRIMNRVHFVGDSMTGDETNANRALSENSEYCRRTLSNLNTGVANWQGSVNGNASREVGTTDSVPSLLSILTAELLGYVAGQQSSFKRTDVLRDIIVFNIGTNDLAFTPVSTGTTLKTNMNTVYEAVRALGYKTVIAGISDRDGPWLDGQTKGNFDLARASYNSLQLAEYTQSTGVTNVWKNANGDLFIDVFNDSKYANASDTTYYKVDKVHWTTTLFDHFADTYLTPAIQLF